MVGGKQTLRTDDGRGMSTPIDQPWHPSPHYFSPKPRLASIFASELERRRAPAGCFELSLVITCPFCLTLVHSTTYRGLRVEYFGGKRIFFLLFWGERLQCILTLWLIWVLCLISTWMILGAALLYEEWSLAQCCCMRITCLVLVLVC